MNADKIIDGENLILGRVASSITEEALKGKDVAIVNCEKMIKTGTKESILERERERAEMKGNPSQGRFYYKRPDMYVRRVVENMLPKNKRGENALDHVNCYIGVPDDLENESLESIESANVKKVPNLKYMQIEEICTHMGWNKQ